ncbi:MAG: hypothetical protein WA821_08600 [Anaerolineales bacterium]
MQKRYAQRLLILLFWALLASCGQNTPAAQVTPLPPSPQPSATTIPTPVPTDVFFPEADQPVQDYMMAGLWGKLILVDGCPRAEGSDGSSVLLLWPYNYTIDRNTHPEQIRDSTGQVVARIGDYIAMAGGNPPSEEKATNGCAGPTWIVGEPIEMLDAYFPWEAGAGGFSSMTDWLEGTLVVVNGCLRVQTNENKSFLLIWPPGPYHWDKNSSQIYDTQGDIQAQVGKRIRVKGGEAPYLQSPPGDITKPMVAQPLPKECAVGPYWNVIYIEK